MTTRRGGASDDVVLRGTWNFLRRGGMVPPSPSQASQKSRKPPRRAFAPRAAGLAAINVLLLQRHCLTPREYWAAPKTLRSPPSAAKFLEPPRWRLRARAAVFAAFVGRSTIFFALAYQHTSKTA